MTSAEFDLEVLYRRFADRKATVGIVGLGYVGLPLAMANLRAGFDVIGVDIDPAKIATLKAGQSYIGHVDCRRIRDAVVTSQFEPTMDSALLARADAILICVPTPLTSAREPDLSPVISATNAIAGNLRPGQLVVLESTTYPGTTRDVVKPILQARGAVSGRDFFLAYSPEREDPGSLQFDISKIPKVVGGDGEEALRLACALYDQLAARAVAVSSLEAAEATKLLENVFRAVNIALVNELKVVYSGVGIDVWQVIEAAKTKPFGFTPFYPGPGVGGHCAPIDSSYLSWLGRKHGLRTRLVDLAREINAEMPQYVVGRVAEVLESRFHQPLAESKLLILGLAYKKNLDDAYESPSLTLFDLFAKQGAKVDYYDPYLKTVPRISSFPHLFGRQSITWDIQEIAGYDAVVIVADHDAVDYPMLVTHARLVFDTRNVCERCGSSGPNVFKV